LAYYRIRLSIKLAARKSRRTAPCFNPAITHPVKLGLRRAYADFSGNVLEGQGHEVFRAFSKKLPLELHDGFAHFQQRLIPPLDAADKLAADGVSAEVIDLRSLRPMDIPTVLESVKKTNRCVVVEEGWPVCSIGSEVSAEIMTHAFDYLDAPVARVAGKDVPMPYAANLEKLALPNVDDVIAAVKSVLYI